MLVHDASTRSTIGYTRVAPVHIGKGVFIGTQSTILPGVTLGEDAIVGAGSVVTSDVAPRTIVAGNPAKEVSDHDAYLSTHQKRLDSHPVWPREGWANSEGISAERREEMIERLREAGRGYIE